MQAALFVPYERKDRITNLLCNRFGRRARGIVGQQVAVRAAVVEAPWRRGIGRRGRPAFGPVVVPRCAGAGVSGLGGPRCRLGREVDAVFFEHRNPARGVALDHHRLVVGVGVAVRSAGGQDAEQDAHHLVGGGDGGALEAASYAERLVIAAELAIVGARGAVGTLICLTCWACTRSPSIPACSRA